MKIVSSNRDNVGFLHVTDNDWWTMRTALTLLAASPIFLAGAFMALRTWLLIVLWRSGAEVLWRHPDAVGRALASAPQEAALKVAPLQILLRKLGVAFAVSLVLSFGLALYLSSPP